MECKKCLIDDRLSTMHQFNGEWYCDECYDLLKNPLDYHAMASEFEDYVQSLKEKNKDKNYDVLFALSGGKDSIAALYFTIEKYHLRPLAFTVDHGFKNDIIWNNCKNIVEHYGIDWFILKVDSPTVKTIGNYATSCDLPCCYCNRLWKGRYFAKAIEITGITDLFIGGDTLERHTAIISRPDYQTDTVGLPLPLNISTEEDIYKICYSLGWTNPGTKGWDTDCIAVGMALKHYRMCERHVHDEEIKHLAHRVRFGILEKEIARKMLFEVIEISREIEEQFYRIINS